MNTVCGVVALTSFPRPDLPGHLDRVVRRFERLNDIPVHVIRESDISGFPLVGPHFARYHAWRLIPSRIERIIYFDVDVLPIAPLPELPKENFAAVEEDSLTSNTARRSITAIRNANSYFNSGFFIADRSTEPFFNRVLDRQTTASKGFVDYMDQTLLNIEIQTALVSQQLSYRKLGTDWCCPHWHLPLEPATSPCMIHFLGGRNSWKMRLISHFAAALDDVQEWLSGSTGDIHG